MDRNFITHSALCGWKMNEAPLLNVRKARNALERENEKTTILRVLFLVKSFWKQDGLITLRYRLKAVIAITWSETKASRWTINPCIWHPRFVKYHFPQISADALIGIATRDTAKSATLSATIKMFVQVPRNVTPRYTAIHRHKFPRMPTTLMRSKTVDSAATTLHNFQQ